LHSACKQCADGDKSIRCHGYLSKVDDEIL
jgi:hypothetical protein